MSAPPADPPRDEAQRLRALIELGLLDTPPETGCDDLAALAAQLCGTPIGLVSLIDATRQWCKARVGLAVSETPRATAFCAHAIAASQPVFVVEDAHGDPRFHGNPLVSGEPHIRFYAAAPIVLADGHAMGTVCVMDTAPRRLDAAPSAALQALARQAAALFESRRTKRAAQRDRQALQRASELLQRMGAIAQVGGWELDVATGRVTWTDEAYRIHEVEPGTDLELTKSVEFYAPAARPVLLAAVEAAIAHGTPWDLELPFVTAKGRERMVRARGEALMEDGRAVRLFGAFQDITLRKCIEAALQTSQERLALALSRPDLALFDWDLRADRVHRGPNFAVMRGEPARETVLSIADVQAQIHPADVLAVRAALRAALKSEAEGYDFEHRIQRADGGWVWLQAVGRVTERGADGRALRVSGTDENIGVRKAAELALAESQHRLRMITDNLPALIAYIDREERYRFLSAQIERVFGVDVLATLGRTMRETRGEAIYALLAPHIAAALRGDKAAFEYAAQVDGRTLHFQSNYIPDVDAAGQVQGFYAMTFDITELKQTQHQLELLARVDTLTGLPNRRQFDERIEEAMLRSRRTLRTMAVMFLDVDHFKAINDSHGHAGGDAVLREVARRLKAGLRATDTVARLAGDEFVVLIEGIDSVLEVGRLADKLVAAMRPRFPFAERMVGVTISVGVAIYRGDAQSASDVLSVADSALYQAKQRGRDRFAIA